MAKQVSGDCTICEKYFSLLHWHHTIPQALGGEDSKQIPLCAQCHNLLHANAEAIVAKLRSGRAVNRTYWANSTEENNAAPWLEILVNAILSGTNVAGKKYVMSFGAPTALHHALQLFKMDSGLKSLEKAIILALSEHLRAKGFIKNDHSEEHKRQSKSRNGSIKNLW